jgi:hypothetical protein
MVESALAGQENRVWGDEDNTGECGRQRWEVEREQIDETLSPCALSVVSQWIGWWGRVVRK